MPNSPDRADGMALTRHMTVQDFASLGLHQVAFVKTVEDANGAPAVAVHGADGAALALAPSRDLAFALIRQNDLEPVSAH